jgi:regulator of protease activity HflC (stomatin/prohibitin superfamily)
MKKARFLIVLLVLTLVVSGCFWRTEVQSSQIGIEMDDGVKISDIRQAGRYTNMGWYAVLATIDVSAQTLTWVDPDLVTADKQPIGLEVGLTYARSRESDCIRTTWEQWRSEATSNEALETQVRNRLPRTAKEVTSAFTIDEMIGRAAITAELDEKLADELSEICVILLDVGINNISPSAEYLALLQDKANAQVAVEVAIEEAKLAEQDLLREQKQTEVELELANRENAVNAALAQTYEESPQYYELERLRLLADVMGDNDKMYFVPEGTNLTLFLAGSGSIPVVPGQ